MPEKHNFLFIHIVISAFSAVIFFFAIYKMPLKLYPENQTFFEFDVVSNISKDRGFSEMTIDSASGHLHFRYNYAKDDESPFAILIFHAHELARHLNLQNYEYIDLDIDPNLSQDFTISMYVYVDGFSDLMLAETHRPYSIKTRVKKNVSHYHYKINDFATPTWWFSHYQVDDKTLPKTNWNNFTHLTISDFGQHPADTTLQVVLKSLKFTDSIKEKASYSVIFALLVFALICFLHPKLKRDKNLTNPKPNKYSEEEANLLLEYIDKNLSNPLLSLDLINKETGMNNFVVNEILKDKKNTHYKNYVDSLRIAKAKQMLLETEHQISVIAEQVGYCYSNSFSRIFGKYEKMTPNEYRTFSRSKSSPK